MKKTFLCLISFLASFVFLQIAYAYSEKTEECIDRVNGVILQRYSTELKDLILSEDGVDDDIADFCLENDSSTNYSDLTTFAQIGQDSVDNFFADFLYGKYAMIGSINIAFEYNVFTSQSRDYIQERLDDEFVSESKTEWDDLLNRGISDGIVYYQDYVDAIDRIYDNYVEFKGLVQEGVDNSYVCDEGVYTSITKSNCICLEGYDWNSSGNACNEIEDEEDEAAVEDDDIDEGQIFNDLVSSDENAEAISYLYEEGIISGYSDGSFKPENSLNRAELLKILVEGKGVTPDENGYSNCFPDVTSDWYAKYVCYAKEQGWVEGYPDGTFLPSSYVNKVEAIKMLLEVFDVETQEPSSSPYSDVPTSEWYAKYIVKAQELGLLEESGAYSPADSITRGGVSENIYRLLIQL